MERSAAVRPSWVWRNIDKIWIWEVLLGNVRVCSRRIVCRFACPCLAQLGLPVPRVSDELILSIGLWTSERRVWTWLSRTLEKNPWIERPMSTEKWRWEKLSHVNEDFEGGGESLRSLKAGLIATIATLHELSRNTLNTAGDFMTSSGWSMKRPLPKQ